MPQTSTALPTVVLDESDLTHGLRTYKLLDAATGLEVAVEQSAYVIRHPTPAAQWRRPVVRFASYTIHPTETAAFAALLALATVRATQWDAESGTTYNPLETEA